MMKIIITFTFCCDNLYKSKFVALEKPGKLGEFFLLLCGHPGNFKGWMSFHCPSNSVKTLVGESMVNGLTISRV